MITFNEPIIGNEEKRMLHEAIDQNSISQGPYVQKFESILSSYCNVKHASACFNATAALHLALAALGIKRDDEVIVPSFTYIATANAAAYLGAKPIFADIKKDTLCIDPKSIEKKINKNTKAIIPVHTYGNMCNMDEINKIAKKNRLFVVEDAAEAIGAQFNGRKAGSLSDIGCLSFHANKIIKTGEGGMCLTNNKELDKKLRLLRSQGKVKAKELKGDDFIEKRYYHTLLGFNYRMTDLQAAIGIAQMKKIDEIIQTRKKIAAIFDEEFSKFGIRSMEIEKDVQPVNWVYPLIFESRKIKLEVGRYLVKRNIPFISFFWPCHKQPFYESNESLPVSEDIWERGFAIPCNPLITPQEAIGLAKTIGNVAKNG